MAGHQWRFSRKKRDWHAYDKLRLIRDPKPVTDRLLHKKGTLLEDRERSWKVRFDTEEGAFFVSKQHAEREGDDTWIIPDWLWEKMIEEGGR